MRPTALIALVLLLSTACGDDDTSDSTAAPGEGLTVAEALDAEGPIRVSGYLFVLDDETVVLADLILESFPPQPGGASVNVEGLSLGTLEFWLQPAPADHESATAQWTDIPVTLTGSMVSGVLVDAEFLESG